MERINEDAAGIIDGLPRELTSNYRVIVMLVDNHSDRMATAKHGYPDDARLIADMLDHLRAVFDYTTKR